MLRSVERDIHKGCILIVLYHLNLPPLPPQNVTKYAAEAKQSCCFLGVFGTTKWNVIVCTLSCLWDEAPDRQALRSRWADLLPLNWSR